MQRILKWAAIIIGTMLALLLVTAALLSISGSSRLNKEYLVETEPMTFSDGTAVVERGQYIVSVSCAGCHGSDLAGGAFFDAPPLGIIPASNLTGGQGGIGDAYSDEDFVRAIRHGVDQEGKPLAIMPSSAFWHFNDEDLGAIIAYVNSLPPVANDPGPRQIKFMGRVLLAAGMLDFLAAEHIDHTAPLSGAQEHQVTAAYGEYLANTGDCSTLR